MCCSYIYEHGTTRHGDDCTTCRLFSIRRYMVSSAEKQVEVYVELEEEEEEEEE